MKKTMRKKRILSAVVAAALSMALVLPAGAVSSSFSDISDQNTAVNADILRLMGVANGVGGNSFNPQGTLTRAEFATMAVKFMQEGDKAPLYATRTIFPDVTAKHWSQAYVNLAASLTIKDGEKDIHLIAGKGDGKFHPDDKITMAETVTILLRVLGYSSKETGTLWPQSFMNLGKSIGLTDGVDAGPFQTITRAQTAQLFVNALNCKDASGKRGYEALGTVTDGTIILAVGVKTDDGSSDSAIRTTANDKSESYMAVGGNVKPEALLGKRGALVLNEKQQIVTFVPDDSSTIQITLSGDAQPSYVKGTDGKRYTMNANTMLYTSAAQEGKSYLEGYADLKSGTQLTMYSENGKIIAVYTSGGMSSVSTEAVVVQGNPSAALFHQLTGGVSSYTIKKGGQTISMNELKPWDVVTYDSMSNTLVVSDLRLGCLYEDAAPNAKTPTSIKVLGQDFEVLESAWDTIKDFDLGQSVSLLLTADGKVAGMAKPESATRTTAIGRVVDEGKVEMFLPNGGTKTLSGTFTSQAVGADQIGSISSFRKGFIEIGHMPQQQPNGPFDIGTMKLGSMTVVPGVRVFEQAANDVVIPINMSDLDMDQIPANQIASYHQNTSGYVDCIVLDKVTGNTYTYGILIQKETEVPSEDHTYMKRTVTVENGTGGLEELVASFPFENGSFGGVVKSSAPAGDGSAKAAAVIQLKAVKGVKPSDFFVSEGRVYVKAGGQAYLVSDDVQCYKSATKSWFTNESGAERLAACKAFSNDLSVHIDPIAQRVRVVAAN